MITVHHLNLSRSTRVLWLLEELGLEYNLVKHQRTPQFRAPDTLKAIHPLGKAPTIEDGPLKLAESAVVLDYINTRYGAGRLAPAPGTDEAWRHQEWLHYGESSAALPIMMSLLGAMTGGLSEGMGRFVESELTKALDYIQSSIGDGPFLFNDHFTIADIQLTYLMSMSRSLGKLESHPGLLDYVARAEARPAFIKAIEVGGPMTLQR